MDIAFFVLISMAMFAIGIIGVLLMRNTLIFFLSVEMMLNAGNLLFVAFARHWDNSIGLAWVFFVLVVAAAEAAVGLAIVIGQFRVRQAVDLDQFNKLRG